MPSISYNLGKLQHAVDATTASFSSKNIIEKLWQKDYTIWRSEEVHRKSILNRLGWLHSIDLMKDNIQHLQSFADEIKNAGFTHVIVLGMGGSSLCPDVCRATFGSAKGYPQLFVLDSTSPTSVLRIEKSINIATSLFIVASKSGGTTETNMFYQYFYDRVGTVKPNPGKNFIAVTDANTKMESIAKEKKFRKIFLNPEDIGGRYSALSYFGLVPMALIGMDLQKILSSADLMRQQSKNAGVKNSAAQIGIAMGEAYNVGRDKLTFISPDEIATFGYWAEQLVAESTGKEGKGIVPIEGEVVSPYDGKKYGTDRLFLFLLLEKEKEKYSAFQQKLQENNQPYITITIKDIYELGSQFFLWEIATAVSAIVLKINPFDEPNVKESKDNTVRVIDEYKTKHVLPKNPSLVKDRDLTFYAPQYYSQKISATDSIVKILSYHFTGKPASDYIGILAYVDQNEVNKKYLYELREMITQKYGIASTVGFGPRYLHSTGQLHKGGKLNGTFLLITADETTDIKIPGEVFSFEVLKNAQALGDYQSIASRNLKLLHLHISGNIGEGLKKLLQSL
ncbi:MAG: glucose-6-phosphate isomerase [Bacteroidota bacterium]|nr:glucose-6-phosphate isomerase [Bacteroidota bacterium]